MQKIAGFFRYYTHFYTKEQHFAALNKWRNGLLFLFILSLYASILPWWGSKNLFWRSYNNKLLPVINTLPLVENTEDQLIINEEKIYKLESSSISIQTTKAFKPGDPIEHTLLISPDYIIISQESLAIPLPVKQLIQSFNYSDKTFNLNNFIKSSPELKQFISIILFIDSCRTLFLMTLIQCAFISCLFYFLHRRLVRAPYICFLKLSILASIPFILIYALFVFYNHQGILATLTPTILHFIFFFRSISSLIEFQNNRVPK